MYTFWCGYAFHFSWSITRCGIAGSPGESMFSFLRSHQTVFCSSCTISHPHKQGFPFLHQHSSFPFLFYLFIYFENLLNHAGSRRNGISFVCGHPKDYEKGKGAKRPRKCVHWLFWRVKRSLAVIKGQLNCGEVKGDGLVSGEAY